MRTTSRYVNQSGFTLVEVIIASVIMIILCVGTLTVFSYAVRINRGNNLRAQAMSILQKEVEYYRSLKYVPVGSDTALNAGTYVNIRTRTSPDGRVFNISVTIDNDPYTAGVQTTPSNATCKFKEITITAVPQIAETSWLADLKTNVAIQRVRAN
ncbi:MAG: type II secretion system protein [Pyrinomonadaceae bacterium]|nr:type II secretion system protein [Pyrinomonadaceae bacterium]MBP6213304.1 type II secretion system protein [Pyrinomonadaceae bacterium]